MLTFCNRGHLEDINDLSWSHDDVYLVSGSVDHTAILWDVEKGQKLVILSDSKHFINGVAWDPLNNYVATMSCDRYCFHLLKISSLDLPVYFSKTCSYLVNRRFECYPFSSNIQYCSVSSNFLTNWRVPKFSLLSNCA